MNDPNERLRRYVRSRAEVPIPRDLHWPSAADDPRPRTSFWSSVRWAGLAGAVVVAAVVVRMVVVTAPSPGDSRGSTDSRRTESVSASPQVGAEFPSSVASMRVVSVAQAVELLQRGDLDGRAAAVAGYFFQALPPCPMPTRHMGPLEDWCRIVAFTDDAPTATLCSPAIGGCRKPSAIHLAPFFMWETSGDMVSVDREPVPMVLIGHADDARQWQCAAVSQDACARAFVVDRIAWANGHDIAPTTPKPRDLTTGKRLVPRLTTDQATAVIDAGDQVLTAAAFRAGDVSTIDPRWNLAGDDIVWVVRSVAEDGVGTGLTRPVMVSLVDDATGTVINTHDLAVDATYRPARLWTIATTMGMECCSGNVYPFYSVRSGDGTLLHSGMIQGGAFGSSHDERTTYGPGDPLALGPGTYSVTVWLARLDGGAIGDYTNECSTEITLSSLADSMLEATFPAVGRPCAFGKPSAPKLTR